MAKRILGLALAIALIAGLSQPVAAQSKDESFRIKIEGTLFRFVNYRFSNIDVWQVKNIKDVKRSLESKDKKKFGGEESGGQANVEGGGAPTFLKTVDELILNRYRSGVQKKQQKSRIEREIITAGLELPEPEMRDSIYNYFFSLIGKARPVLKNAYMITTRIPKDSYVPGTIIGLIVSFEDEDLERNIDRPSPDNVFTYDELKQFDLDKNEFGADNLYELMMTNFLQNNVIRKTLEAQGIGTTIAFAPKVHGNSESLIVDENDASSADIQSFLRISEGQPYDYVLKEHEIIASPDLISWRRYEMQIEEYAGGSDTITTITNKNLPKFGIEMRYGMEEISYASLWSERLSVNAMWENVKLGMILPTNGWSAMAKETFDQQRKLTHGGFGVYGAADFPFKVVRSSGIFHFGGSYIFGDAEEADYKTRGITYENFDAWMQQNSNDPYWGFDYLIRANAQLHYTFGISIDEDYLMRFGIGATFYNVEKWTFEKKPDFDDPDFGTVGFKKSSGESIFGMSGKIEVMARNVVTPYGASIQYFDESLMANLWLQIPVIENMFSIRLDAKGFFTAFRDKPRVWENSSVFTPMARLIFNF